MSSVAFSSGSTVIYWSGLVIAIGIMAGFLLSYSIWTAHTNKGAALWAFLPIAVILSVIFCRLMHYYCHDEQYKSFISAITDYNTGGYALAGTIFAVWLAAIIVKALGLVKYATSLLDVIAPGYAMAVAFIRLSALFGTSCRSKFTVSNPSLQTLPFAVTMTDSAGNTEYRFASFFIEFIIFMAISLLMVFMYYRSRGRKMLPPERRHGHVARICLALYSAVELVMDSTRYDSLTIHFRTSLLQSLNKFASFIKLAQVIAAVSLVVLLVHYVKMSVRARGWRWYHIAACTGFLAATVCLGYLGEYWVQRAPDTAKLRYAIMSAGAAADALIVYLMYRSCIATENFPASHP